MSIGDRIKALRDENNMTQTELADMIGTTKQNIYKYETGIITNIPSDKIESMATQFHVSPAYIMGWEQRDNDERIKLQVFTGEENNKKAAFSTSSLSRSYNGIEPKTSSKWIDILASMNDDNRQKLQDYAELLLLKQDQGDQED